jgi:hypothetical protein
VCVCVCVCARARAGSFVSESSSNKNKRKLRIMTIMPRNNDNTQQKNSVALVHNKFNFFASSSKTIYYTLLLRQVIIRMTSFTISVLDKFTGRIFDEW